MRTLATLQNAKHTASIRVTRDSPPRYTNENWRPHTNLYMNVYSGVIPNCQKVKTTQSPIPWMVYPYNEVTFSHKKEWGFDSGYNVDAPRTHHTLRDSIFMKGPEESPGGTWSAGPQQLWQGYSGYGRGYRHKGKRVKQQKVEKQILTHMDIIYDERDTTEHGKRTAFSKIVLGSGWISVASFAATPKTLGW